MSDNERLATTADVQKLKRDLTWLIVITLSAMTAIDLVILYLLDP